jgi:hypothetical protein
MTKGTRRKPAHSRAIKITLTCDPVLYEEGKRWWEARRFSGISEYLQSSIRRDLGLAQVVTLDEQK